MFGISWTELLVIILVTILVVPSENWPDIAKFLAKCIKFIRNLIWKISDASENIKEQIELEKPINDLIKNTTDDVLSSFSSVRSNTKKSKIVKNKVSRKTKGSSKS
ncbi:MAG: twin-arginine translocase TatA/TatE family subunit [Alphaproteobacteria bacterium]|nr:twin-arginine translocase TatA/TatE family subunit [Alphaproteobacteria bacterium]MBN2675549.1 twin-arginine translocase TatA/TatE family subunit [Alphaproteobacteria bacterium]